MRSLRTQPHTIKGPHFHRGKTEEGRGSSSVVVERGSGTGEMHNTNQCGRRRPFAKLSGRRRALDEHNTGAKTTPKNRMTTKMLIGNVGEPPSGAKLTTVFLSSCPSPSTWDGNSPASHLDGNHRMSARATVCVPPTFLGRVSQHFETTAKQAERNGAR